MSEVKFSADIKEEFGRWMQAERESKGIMQKFVADKINITVTQLSRIENGKSGTERDTVILWARAVGVDENEALRRFKPENSNEETHDVLDGVKIIFQDGKGLTKKQQQEILNAARLIAKGVIADNDSEKPK